jgi:DNA-binding transcriptional MerR regulator
MPKQSQIGFDFGDVEIPQPAIVKKPKEKKQAVVEVPQQVTMPVIKKKSTRGRKSFKELARSVDLVDVPEDEILFQKSYYSIGKVAEMFKVNQSLIRLWEKEFDVLKPKKNGKGDRLFRPEDIKNIQLIHHLTREKKYTMEGAKEYFKNNKKADEKFAAIEALKKLKGFLNELRANM